MEQTQKIKPLLNIVCVGATLEWFDLYLFASLSESITEKFFPFWSSSSSSIGFWLSLFGGILFRPFGAYFFGYLGDSGEKKKSLLATLWLQAWGIGMIAFLPSYSSIGYLATIVFIIIRCVQGFAYGGSYAGIIYLQEELPAEKRGLLGNLPLSFAPLGLLIAAIFVFLLREFLAADFFLNFGWRIPFSFAFIPLAYFAIRHKSILDKSNSDAISTNQKNIFLSIEQIPEAILWLQKNRFLIVKGFFGIALAQATLWYIAHEYSFYFLSKILKVNSESVNIVILFATLVSAPFFAIAGLFLDFVGKKRFLLSSIFFSIVLYIPLYIFIVRASGFYFGNPFEEVNANISILVILIALQMILAAIAFAVTHQFFGKIFTGTSKYRSIFLCFQIANFTICPLISYFHIPMVRWIENMYAGLLIPIIFLLIAATICGLFVEE